MDEQDEDALFDQLAKNLQAVRQDAELVRSRGVEALSAGVARAEAALETMSVENEALRQRLEQQQAVTERLEAAAVKSEADLERLRQTVNELSRRMRAQAELLDQSSTREPRRGAWVEIGAIVVIAGCAAAWIASDRVPGIDAIAQRVVVRVSELGGMHPPPPGLPAVAAQPDAPAVPAALPLPADRPAGASRSEPAATGAAISSPAAASAAMSSPAVAGAAMSSPAATGAAMSSPAVTGAAMSSPAATGAAVSSPAATGAAMPSPAVAGAAISSQRDAGAVSPALETTGAPDITPASPHQAGATTPPPAVTAPAPALAAMTHPGATAPAATTPPPLTQTASQQPAIVPPSLSPQSPQAFHVIVLHAISETWVQVRQSGVHVLLTRNMKAGESWPVPAEPDLTLDTGNADGLILEIDGVPTRLAAARGGVIRRVPLDADLLASGAALRVTH